MIFSKEKSYITRELKIVDFIEKYIDTTAIAFPNKFVYKYNGLNFNVTNNGRYHAIGSNSKKDILTEINKPDVYIPDDLLTKPKCDRNFLTYEFHIDDLFNIIRCSYEKQYLSVNTFASKISKEAFANANHPEIEFEDGTLGVIIESIKLIKIQDQIANKIKYLSKAIDIKLEGI